MSGASVSRGDLYVAKDDLVYVRTADSGPHGVPVLPGEDVPGRALPEHLEKLVDRGLIKKKPAAKPPTGSGQLGQQGPS